MDKQKTFKDLVLEYNKWLENIEINLPNNYELSNPFNGINKDKIEDISIKFYNKYYNDFNKRYLILGSSPARKGTAITGIPFEDAYHLYQETGIMIDEFYINKTNSNFLYDVMENYGGLNKFYQDFYMNFVCPLGIVNINDKGNKINANYYENKKIERALHDFIVESLKRLIDLGIDTSVCFCIGSGENFKFLKNINEEYHFFDLIIALEHPRFIMQYNKNKKDEYLKKYIDALKSKSDFNSN